MSFGSAMRFEVDSSHGKPAIFWDQGKQPQKNRKFGYKNRELRHPIRGNPRDGPTKEMVVFHHDRHKTPHQPLTERTEQEEDKPQKPVRPAKDFIKRNRQLAGGKKKAEIDHGNEKRKTDHPMANTVTLTQEQLNAILASVGKMASGKENALRISIDNEKNEIQIGNAALEEVKDSPKDDEKKVDKEEEPEEEGNIFALLKEPKKEATDGPVKKEGSRSRVIDKPRGVKHHKKRDDDVSESLSTDKVERKKEKREKSKKSVESEKGKESDKVEKIDVSEVKDEEKPGERDDKTDEKSGQMLHYESPRVVSKHLTVAERKRLQWARERAELSQNYDPWGRPGAGAPLRDPVGHVLADYNNRKDDLQKPVDEGAGKSSPKATVRADTEKIPEKSTQQQVGDTSPPSKATIGGFIINEDKVQSTKDDEKKKWLEELEKQREEQRQKKLKSKNQVKSVPDDTWADRFSTHKPAPLPQQDAVSAAKEKHPVQTESSSFPNIANPQHAAIRSSFVSGNAAPDDKKYSQSKEEEKKKWLQDLEKQIEEKRLRKMMEKDRDSGIESDTWADRFSHHQNTNQSALQKFPDPEVPHQQDSPGRVSSAPQQLSARELPTASDNLENTFLRGQNVVIDPVTRQELEYKKRRYIEHQDALKRQIEEKERLKREEKNRKMLEEMEAEAKLRKERDALQNQFNTEQQKIKQKEEARQRRIDELKMAMDEAQEKAQQEKLIRRMEHLRQGGHDVSHLQAHLDEPDSSRSLLTDHGHSVTASPVPAMSPRVHHVEPTHVPGLNLRQSQESSTGHHHPEISSRTVDLPNPVFTTQHEPYTENRVLTPSRYRHPSQPKPSDPSSPMREFGTQTLEEDLYAEKKREASEVEIEYKEIRREKATKPVKKVRVKSAEQEVKVELRRGRKKERVETLQPGEKKKWNYQNQKLKRPIKQSERDPLYERNRQRSEERRARRERELLAMVELNKPIIPDEHVGYRSRDPSPGKDNVMLSGERGHKGKSLSPDRHGIVKQQVDNSLSPNRSIERERGRWHSPVRYRSPSPPVPALRTHEMLGHSPPVPALKHRREGGKGEKAQVLKVNDSDGFSNHFDNDQYNYSNYRPASGQRQGQGHYQERNPIEAPVDSGDFVPFTRTTEVLDPAKAVDPIQLSRENTQVKLGRKAYTENHNPGSYGTHIENIRDRQERNDPILNPELVKGHPTARQDMILQQLSTLKKSLIQRQRELETCMSPSDYDQ